MVLEEYIALEFTSVGIAPGSESGCKSLGVGFAVFMLGSMVPGGLLLMVVSSSGISLRWLVQ